MNPIAQTFFINEPVDGSAGVYVTKIDLFFKSKSPTSAVTVQIRETDNGNPTSILRQDFASVTIPSASVNTSEDASLVTTFVFPSPVFLLSQQSYAFVVIPEDYSEEYKLWTSELASAIDVTTGVPIKKNNDTGTLFLSSNGRQFTAVQTEDIKFQLYIAKFKSTSGTVAYKPGNEDRFYVKDIRGGAFQKGERIYVSNGSFNLAKITYTQNTGNFQVGETVYQANSTANVAIGQIYSDSNHVMKIVNCTGQWVTTSYPDFVLHGGISLVTANSTAISQTISTVNGSKNITVPFTEYFSDKIDSAVYIRNKIGNVSQITQLKNVVDSTTLTLNTPSFFTDSYAELGRIYGNGAAFGFYNGPTDQDIINPDSILISLEQIVANTTYNFANPKGKLMIGLSSKSSANIISLIDNPYNSMHINFAQATPPSTNINYSFIGTNNDIFRTTDGGYMNIANKVTSEFYDKERVISSRSSELNGLNGDSTLNLRVNLSTTDLKISPVIDDINSSLTFTYNIISKESEIVGWRLYVSNTNGDFVTGDIVSQGNSSVVFGTGTVSHYDDDIVTVTGTFNDYFLTTVKSDSRLIKVSDPNVNSVIDTTYKFGEITDVKNNPYSSRYISKTVILDEGQDAEDLRCYLTAYRPSGTSFYVYAKFKNKDDKAGFSQTGWTLLRELSSPSLLSSLINKNDFVELEYGLPRSNEIIAQGATCDSTSNIITMSKTQSIGKNAYIYLKDNNSSNFNLRQVMQIVDTNNITLHLKPSFTSDNVAIGLIRFLNGPRSAFIYTENNNIIRYVDRNDTIYDGYKNFAIKIVPLSNTSYIVPRCQDMRAIALQI